MKIKKLELRNFKRFTDLTIDNINKEVRLVLLIGASGSEKSSVFDAFELFNTIARSQVVSESWHYYRKDKNKEIRLILTTQNDEVWTTEEKKSETFSNYGNDFYGRTSFRQIPSLTRTSLGTGFDFSNDSHRPELFIEKIIDLKMILK